MAKKKTHEQFEQDIIRIYNLKKEDFELLSKYQGYDKEITFKCNRCGLIKTVRADSLLKKKKNKKHICRCYEYSENWHQLLNEFNHWKKEQNNYELLEEFRGTRVNLLIKCLKCGATQRRSVKALIQDDSCLCCNKKNRIRKTHEQFVKELNNLYGEEYTPIEKYIDSMTPILVRHTNCGKIYKTKPHNLLTNKGGHCPVCGVISKGEKAIATYLEQHGIVYRTQMRLDEIKRAPYDFYLPDYNLLIEYQGIQHFQPIHRFGGEKSFMRQQEIDKLKKDKALELNYNFLAIKYTDFDKIPQILAQRLSRGGE